MHAYGGAPHAADHLSVDIQLIGQDPLLGMVELIGKTIGKMVERRDHLPGNQFEQCGWRLTLGAKPQRLAGGFDGVQLMPATGDEYFLGSATEPTRRALAYRGVRCCPSSCLPPADRPSHGRIGHLRDPRLSQLGTTSVVHHGRIDSRLAAPGHERTYWQARSMPASQQTDIGPAMFGCR